MKIWKAIRDFIFGDGKLPNYVKQDDDLRLVKQGELIYEDADLNAIIIKDVRVYDCTDGFKSFCTLEIDEDCLILTTCNKKLGGEIRYRQEGFYVYADEYVETDKDVYEWENIHTFEWPTLIITVKTDNTGASNDNQFTMYATGEYHINWGDGTIENNVSGNQTHTYDSIGTYTIKAYAISDFGVIPGIDPSNDIGKVTDVQSWGTQSFSQINFEGFSGAYTATDTPSFNPDGSLRFAFASSNFNEDVGDWNTSSVTNTAYMFWNNSAFNQNIDNWDVSKVSTISAMFNLASAFDQPLNSWDTSSVTDMSYLFRGIFNQPLSNWDTSKVTNMSSMFGAATVFNQDISAWNVSNVTNMKFMFRQASAFNQDIGGWDVSKVEDFSYMFYSATAFDQDLSEWDISNAITMANMLDNCDMSVENYSKFLISCANQVYNGDANTGLNLGATSMTYNNTPHTTIWGSEFTDAVSAHNYLTTTASWTITGDSEV